MVTAVERACELCQRGAYDCREFRFPSRYEESVYICGECLETLRVSLAPARVTGVCMTHGKRYNEPPTPCPACWPSKENGKEA